MKSYHNFHWQIRSRDRGKNNTITPPHSSVRSTGSQERRTKQKQSQTKDQIENVDLFKETNKVNICSRERNVRAVKRQLRCDRDKNKKEHKNSVFVEGNKDKIKSGRDKINIRKNRKRENNTRGKIQQRKGKEREKER